MKHIVRFILSIAITVLLPLSTSIAVADDYYRSYGSKIYTMTNSADANELIELTHYAYGELFESNRFATGGKGTGGGLGNQGGIVASEDGSLLFAVNAGSNSISVFKKTPWGIRLVDTQSSQGERPVSITQSRNLVYVLNVGSDSIAGFYINRRGKLHPYKIQLPSLVVMKPVLHKSALLLGVTRWLSLKKRQT